MGGRPPRRLPFSCVRQSATSGTRPAPDVYFIDLFIPLIFSTKSGASARVAQDDGGEASLRTAGVGARRRDRHRPRRGQVFLEREAAGVRGVVSRFQAPDHWRPVTYLAALGRRRGRRDQAMGEKGCDGREGLRVDRCRGCRGRRVESRMWGASQARHRRKESLGWEDSRRNRNRCR